VTGSSAACPGQPGPRRQEDLVYGLSCLIYRDSSMSELLLGIRRATRTSKRHPGVLSTPTMRLPRSMFESAVGSEMDGIGVGKIKDVISHRTAPIGAGQVQIPETFMIEALMARKLGVGEALVMGRIGGQATAVSVAFDDVADPLGTELSERTIMASYSVPLDFGAEHLPAATTSYSRLIWAKARLVCLALHRKDALIVDETLNPFEVCIDGLCIQSAVRHIERMASQ